MIRKTPLIALIVVFLLALTPLVAGCLSVPGPGDEKRNPVVTTANAPSSAERTTVPQTPVVRRTSSAVSTPLPVTTLTGTAPTVSGSSCVQQGGTEVQPGYQCTGTWLTASDTFSCCSKVPVRETPGTSNKSATVIPSAFSLIVNLDDNPGSITP